MDHSPLTRCLLLSVLLALWTPHALAQDVPEAPPAPAETGEAPERSPLEVFLEEYAAQPVSEVPVNRFDGRAGPADAPVRIVVLSDIECRPYCKRAAEGLDDLLVRYEGLVEVVYKNYPLDSSCNPSVRSQMHPSACSLARGLQCAGEQGAFWAYHRAAYGTDELNRETAQALAVELGLAGEQWDACYGGEEVLRQLARQGVDGARLGMRGTPHFFINGRGVRGAAIQRVEAALRWELSEAGRTDIPVDETGVFPR